MPGPTSVKCPHCDAHLKLNDQSKLGKQMTCPKCKKPFKAEALDDDESEFGALAKSSRAEEDEEESPPPRRPAAAHRSGGAKKKPQGRPTASKLPLILSGVVVAGIFVGGGVAISHFLGREKEPAAVEAPAVAEVAPAATPIAAAVPAAPAPAVPAVPVQKKFDFSWLPPQSEAVIYVRPAELLKSAFAQWLIDAVDGRKQWDEAQGKLQQDFGITLGDVDSLAIGIKSTSDLTAEAAKLAPGGMPNPMQAMGALSKLREQEMSGVIRLTKSVDLPSLRKFKEEVEPISYNSVTYYREKSLDGVKPGSQCLYILSPTVVIVCGREDIMKSLLDRQGKSEPRAELEFIDPEQHLAFAFVPKRDAAAPPAADSIGRDPLAKFKNVESSLFGNQSDRRVDHHRLAIVP